MREKKGEMKKSGEGKGKRRNVDAKEGRRGRGVFFFSSRRRHTRYSTVSWARECV